MAITTRNPDPFNFNDDLNEDEIAQLIEGFKKQNPEFLRTFIAINTNSVGHPGYADRYGHIKRTPLAAAVYANKENYVKTLIKAGATVSGEQYKEWENLPDEDTRTSHTLLELAVNKGNTKIVQLLLEAGANPLEHGRYETAVITADVRTHERSGRNTYRYMGHWPQMESLIHKASLKSELHNYIYERKKERSYHLSFNLFGHQFNFGYSRNQKIAAVLALINVLDGIDDPAFLTTHMDVLTDGRLGKIVDRYNDGKILDLFNMKTETTKLI